MTDIETLKRWAIRSGILGIILLIVSGSFYVVEPTEMAGVRRLGTVLVTKPVKPGIHLKLPFIDTADKLQVSVDNFRIQGLKVYTIDNQSVIIDVGITYKIPDDAVLRLLYHVGRSGDVDHLHNVTQIIADRALKIFAKRNTVKISEERDTISAEVFRAVAVAIRHQFGFEIIDLQIPEIRYSDTFVASVEAAVKAKNDAIAAENTVTRIRYEGEQRVVTAKAEAAARIAKAEAEKKASILEAQGIAEAYRLKGQALKDNPRLVEMTVAERWSGTPPQTVLGGGSTAMPFFSIGGTTGRH